MDLIPLESESRKEGEMELHHIGHEHPLLFIQHHSVAREEEEDKRAGCCFMCGKTVEGWCYGCNECKFYLHKGCAEVDLDPRIKRPFHAEHPLTFLPKFPYSDEYVCDFCGRGFWGFVYHCDPCQFDLHINCAFLPSSMFAKFPKSLHPHPLFFLENHNQEVKHDCSGCKKSLSGPIYRCYDCSYESNFSLHKECAELPLEIIHPFDRKHPLTLLPNKPTHPQNCSCYLCRTQWGGFVYSCSLCSFDLSIDDYLSPPTIIDESHEHPWTLVSRKMSFICDFCGTAGEHSPYLCTVCNLLVHKKCISLPRRILLTRHHHVITLSYSLRQNHVEDWTCRICYQEVETWYGCYCCSASNCHYTAHVNCATDPDIWDGKIIPEDYDEISMDSSSLITAVFEQVSIGEQMVASEIEHAYHDHNLTLTFSGGQINDDCQCDGCMRPISTPFYSCGRCKYFLHKYCAELPREMRHPFHRHLLKLTKQYEWRDFSSCDACSHKHNGFSYRCSENGCSQDIYFDIRCMLLSDTLKHPSHEHSLYLVHNFAGHCSGCHSDMFSGDNTMAYRCMKRCDFTLDIRCATQPLTAWYKCDKHDLTLTYSDDSDPSQHYCDLCEDERQPNDWFYRCADCDTSLHSNCAIGAIPYRKLGCKVELDCHHHPLTLVKNIWNCPPCKMCHEVCNGQALECKESECNFTVHWDCRFFKIFD